MLFSNYIFDLDGTLTDSRQGIFNSLVYALQQLGYNEIPASLPKGFVGPPLQKGFETIFGMNRNEVKQAVNLFREYYNDKGWKENIPYDGIIDMLSELSQSNVSVFVATAKFEEYSNRIIKHFDLDTYIQKLYGANYEEKKTGKTHIIERAVIDNNLDTESTVVIGDTHFDINGAKELNLKSIAVGYGFSDAEDLKKLEPDYFVEEVEDLYQLIII